MSSICFLTLWLPKFEILCLSDSLQRLIEFGYQATRPMVSFCVGQNDVCCAWPGEYSHEIASIVLKDTISKHPDNEGLTNDIMNGVFHTSHTVRLSIFYADATVCSSITLKAVTRETVKRLITRGGSVCCFQYFAYGTDLRLFCLFRDNALNSGQK